MGSEYTYVEDKIYASESTPISIRNVPSGKYSLIAEKDGLVGETIIETSGGIQEAKIILNKPAYYSVIYDKTLASEPPSISLTYTGANAGFTPIQGKDMGSWQYLKDTIFDSITFGYFDADSNFIEYPRIGISEGHDYNWFVRFPRIYQRVTDISSGGDGSKVQLDLSIYPFSGSSLHPAFIVDGKKIKYRYIARYLRDTADNVSMDGGYSPKQSPLSNHRSFAKNLGSNYGVMTYYDWDLVNKLILLGFKTWNLQPALGYGYVDSNDFANNGLSDDSPWLDGNTSYFTVMSVFGLENWWGNSYQMLDNFIMDSTGIYAGNLSNSVDDKSSLTKICDRPSINSSFPLTCRAGLNDFFIGETDGGSKITGLCDLQGFPPSYATPTYYGIVGHEYSGSYAAGPFHLSYCDMNRSFGARIVHWE